MVNKFKRVLYIDLENKKYEFKIHEDLYYYLGGIGIAYKLLLDNIDLSPIVLATGPLSGKFPYVSKAALVYISNGKLVDLYGGGTIGSLMNLADINAIVFHGNSNNDLKINISQRDIIINEVDSKLVENKNVNFYLSKDTALSENYFSFGVTKDIFVPINTKISLSIDYTESNVLTNFYDYDKVYNELLKDFRKLMVEPRNNPSCFGCPMGCDYSAKGENDLNLAVLPRCLVSCGYAEDLFKEIPLVFSCLRSLGFVYKHSDLEKLPNAVGKIRAKLNKILEKNDILEQ